MSFLFSFMPYQLAWKLLVPGCALQGWRHVVCVVGVMDTPTPAVCQKYTLTLCQVVLTKERTMSWCCRLLGKMFPFQLMLSLCTLIICILCVLVFIECNCVNIQSSSQTMDRNLSHLLDHGLMMVIIKVFLNYVYLIFWNYLSQVFDENVWKIAKWRSSPNLYAVHVDWSQ